MGNSYAKQLDAIALAESKLKAKKLGHLKKHYVQIHLKIW